MTGQVLGDLNATFFTLIPKIAEPLKYNDFRLISLCNLLYKVIAKFISNCIKSGLSRGISQEQFGFLNQRLIFYVVGAAQETIHSTKVSHSPSFVLKIDLVKAYDLID